MVTMFSVTGLYQTRHLTRHVSVEVVHTTPRANRGDCTWDELIVHEERTVHASAKEPDSSAITPWMQRPALRFCNATTPLLPHSRPSRISYKDLSKVKFLTDGTCERTQTVNLVAFVRDIQCPSTYGGTD